MYNVVYVYVHVYLISVDGFLGDSDGDAHERDHDGGGSHFLNIDHEWEVLWKQTPSVLLELSTRRPVASAIKHLHVEPIIGVWQQANHQSVINIPYHCLPFRITARLSVLEVVDLHVYMSMYMYEHLLLYMYMYVHSGSRHPPPRATSPHIT